MFANDKSIDNLQDLFKEFRKYLELQGQYLRLEAIEKLTILLSTLILIFILVTVGVMALFYFSFMLVYVLATAVGSLIAGYAIVGILLIAVALLIYRFRVPLIFQPMVNFLAQRKQNHEQSTTEPLYPGNDPPATDRQKKGNPPGKRTDAPPDPSALCPATKQKQI